MSEAASGVIYGEGVTIHGEKWRNVRYPVLPEDTDEGDEQ